MCLVPHFIHWNVECIIEHKLYGYIGLFKQDSCYPIWLGIGIAGTFDTNKTIQNYFKYWKYIYQSGGVSMVDDCSQRGFVTEI